MLIVQEEKEKWEKKGIEKKEKWRNEGMREMVMEALRESIGVVPAYLAEGYVRFTAEYIEKPADTGFQMQGERGI